MPEGVINRDSKGREPEVVDLSDIMFMQIPVYRVSGEDYLQDVEARVNSFVAAGHHPEAERERWKRIAWGFVTRGEGYSYNQIVGWVELRWNGPGPVIKGDAFKLPQSRVNRVFTRRYDWLGKVLESWFYDARSSDQIAASLREDLLSLAKPGDVFAGRHIDLEAFDNLAKYIDWMSLVGYGD